MAQHTIIKIRRTDKSIEDSVVVAERPEDGEIEYINNKYLVVGDSTSEANKLPRFKAFDQSIVDLQVFHQGDQLKNENNKNINPKTKGTNVSVTYQGNAEAAINKLNDRVTELDKPDGRIPQIEKNIETMNGLLTPKQVTDVELNVIGCQTNETKFSGLKYNTGVTVNTKGQLKGAAWNDFAEYRLCYDEYIEPGDVVCEFGNGLVERSIKRLQPGAAIVSDTYGMVIGPAKPECVPVAVAGRVLAKVPLDEEFKVGDPVCAGEYGMVSKMNRLEVILFPDRIIGYVSEIPDYTMWNDTVEVRDRIWIKVK